MLDKTILKLIDSALLEDIGKGDITTNILISPHQISTASIVSKEEGILCGLEIARAVFKRLDSHISFKSSLKDGQKFKSASQIIQLKGKTRAILTGERVALNFLSYLSGIATKTNSFVQQIKPHKTKILDTRKTTPGLRVLEKLAVRCGGGSNHRSSLDEMFLFKDNHWTLNGKGITAAIKKIKLKTKTAVEVEVDTFEQFTNMLDAQPDIILLDNMSIAELKKAVALKLRSKSKIQLEASGGISLSNVRRVAQTGVDRISVGELTHKHSAIDFSLELLSP